MKEDKKRKKGFTIIEVMLVLAITGLLLVGTIRGTYSAVRTQRYNDAVNTFAENLRQVYNEVLNPRSEDDASGTSKGYAIYGKVLQFGGSTLVSGSGGDFSVFFSATLVGDVNLDEFNASNAQGGFMPSLAEQGATVACGTITSKPVLWGAQAYNTIGSGYTGIIIIARHPRTGAVHTVVAPNYRNDFYIEGSCEAARSGITQLLKDNRFSTEEVTFCIKSDEASVVRAVRLAKDGANSSAVSILTEEESREAGCK